MEAPSRRDIFCGYIFLINQYFMFIVVSELLHVVDRVPYMRALMNIYCAADVSAAVGTTLQFGLLQSQGISDDGDRTETHGSSSDNR